MKVEYLPGKDAAGLHPFAAAIARNLSPDEHNALEHCGVSKFLSNNGELLGFALEESHSSQDGIYVSYYDADGTPLVE